MTSDAVSPTRQKRRRGGLGIQSKLLIMLLVVSVLSITVTGVIGYLNGRDALRDAAFEQMTTIRELRTFEIETALNTIRTGVVLDSRTKDSVEASRAFNAAFAELEAAGEHPDERAVLLDYYESTFIPDLEARSGNEYEPAGLLPYSEAGIYLQAHYTAQHTDFDEALTMMDAGDGSAWSAAHALYHPYYRGLVEDLAYEDVLLVNMDGQVVYSAYKGVDLGLDLFAAPANQSTLAQATAEVLRTGAVDAVAVTDFERYVPSLNIPTAWIVSPIGEAGGVTGALAVQVPIETINDTLTGAENWREQGLGATGEVYLVGDDRLMRSISRHLVEDPESYAAAAIANGTPPAIAARVVEVGGTVLLQPVDTEPVARALRGESGTMLTAGYLGANKLASYAPLDIDGVRWVVVASIDEAEAFAPVDAFTRTVLLSAALLVLLVAVLALLLARVFTRPLDRLLHGVRRLAGGERDVEVDTGTRDEFAEVGAAFNDMSRSLQTKADLLDAERAESERMLLSLMPATVAERYRQGDETIAEDHSDVTVIYADIVGFDDYTASMDSGRSLATLNEIVTGLDELAARLGIERVRTTKQGYLASCGLVLPRVDSARRVVEFAAGAQELVTRLSGQWGTHLSLRAGIDSGNVTSGLVGRNSVVYDMWGEAVNLAYRLQDVESSPGVYLSQRVVDRLGDMFPVEDAGTVQTKGGAQRAWRLLPENARV